MRFSVLFSCDNDAFGVGRYQRDEEVAAVLRELADKVEHNEASLKDAVVIRDVNGNAIGNATYVEEEG